MGALVVAPEALIPLIFSGVCEHAEMVGLVEDFCEPR